MKPFINEKFLDFTDPDVLVKMQNAISLVEKKFGKTYPIIIGKEKILTRETITSFNPSNVSQVVGKFSSGTKMHAEKAINTAFEAFKSWSKTSAKKRAEYLFDAASEIRKRRLEINAWLILEVGKNYIEADADTCEAIDFLEYYGREMLRLSKSVKIYQLPGEKDELKYFPLGVGVVVSPWNFPFAILIGMTSASIVAGNTVVVKPSSDSPGIATLMMEIWEKVKLPNGVVNFVTGSGKEVGDFLVSHPKVRFISFTGSKEVGLRINELAAKHQMGQKWIKKVIAEMGGKNAIIVDKDADMNEAIKAVIASSFGFQGQKCSACSRVIVAKEIYNEFAERLAIEVEKLKIGQAKDNFFITPVINKQSLDKVLSYIEIGKKEGKLIAGGEKYKENGYFVKPTVFKDIKPKDRIAQEEIFGPVVAIIKAKDFNNAIEIANDVEYGLTGAVFTKDKNKITKAIEEFHCGNLYINRKCTGAMVGSHPFGGFNLSGTNSKAGGPDYISLFLQAKAIGEKNT